MNGNRLFDEMKGFARLSTGPIMHSYADWIVNEAYKRGLKRIYFLARDGYLLCEMAKRICSCRGFPIECRYLYCSRQSLRTPSYHLIGEEAYRLLLFGGYYVTPKTVLERAMLTKDEREKIYKELMIEDENRSFSDNELEQFREKITKSSLYRSIVRRNSKNSYKAAMEYFKQEGLFDFNEVAIADSGWTGSMQRSLRQLLESGGFKGKITGFYFGMYVKPLDENDGEYLNFYFDHRRGTLRKVLFSNNLFECMLSAPHSMTLGYEIGENGVALPRFAPEISKKQLLLTEAQLKGALDYTDTVLENAKPFDEEKALKTAYKTIKKYMVHPSREYAEVYGSFSFCDDVTEGYQMSLADPENINALANYMLIPRIFRKLFKIKKANATELFWPYGVVAFRPAMLRPWYRINIQAWELLKALLKK